MMIHQNRQWCVWTGFIFVLIFFLTPPLSSMADGYEALVGVIDIRTVFSDGDYTADELISIAKSRGIDVLVITDHDRMVLQYGLFPFRNTLRFRVEKPSVLKNGAREYLAMLNQANAQDKDIIIIPGLESAPFYYWTGWPFPGKLTAHEWEKHLLILGIEDPEKIRSLPILHSFHSVRYIKHHIPFTLLYAIPFILCLGLLLIKKKRQWWVWTLLFISLFLLINHLPFASSPFDPYHGDQGIKPYQELIDYVNDCGGMCFWSHPETTTGVRDLGTIKVSTPPHREDLLKAIDYTGFAAIYGDIIKATEPGMEWDQVLNEYCVGIRKRPAWGISSSDYHNEHPAPFGTYTTTFLVKNRSKPGVLEAIQSGRMYNYIGPMEPRIILDVFELEDVNTGKKAIMGGSISCTGLPILKIKAHSSHPEKDGPLTLRIIRSGQECYQKSAEGVLDLSWCDLEADPDLTHFYRIEIRGKGRMLSNPIFVTPGSSH